MDNCRGIGKYAGADKNNGGYWNDGSLQLSAGTGCVTPQPCTSPQQCTGGQACMRGFCTGGTVNSATCMTPARHRSQFTAWAVLGLNLVLTGNLPRIHAQDPATMATWSNAEVVAVNQDAEAWSAARPGKRLDAGPNLVPPHTSTAPMGTAEGHVQAHVAECGGEPSLQLWNLSTHGGTVYNPVTKTYLAMAGCSPKDLIYDGCSFNPDATTCAGMGNYSHFGFTLEPATGQLKAHYVRDGDACVTVGADSSLTTLPCVLGKASQTWMVSGGQLQNGANCMTNGAPPPARRGNATAVYGRALGSRLSPAAGAYAVMLLNDGENESNVTCDASCVAAMALPDSFPDAAYMRDLWGHTQLAPVASIREDGLSMRVAGGGASLLLKLCATAAECESAVMPRGVGNDAVTAKGRN